MTRKMKKQSDWVATSRADGASQHMLRTRSCLVAAAVSVCFTSPVYAYNPLPTGGQGNGTFNQAGNVLTITTNANRALLKFDTFNIAQGYTVNEVQPSASSIALNSVLSADPTRIFGTLTSNGRVLLINPAGILIGQSGRIDTAGFIASTLNISDANFLANKLKFDATPGAGNVINQGTITTPSGGSVYLVATNVTNEGIITTPQGETILAAGQTVTLLDTGTPGVSVEITGAEGNATNLGQVVADAGRIGIAGVLVRNSGTLNASSAVNQGGRIFLKASQDAYVDGDGRIVTTGTKGGKVEVLGNRVAVMDNASIDASGTTGGGTVLIGGDYQGKNAAVKNSTITYFGPNASIKADATDSGNGGKVIIWANDTTRAYGSISAKGGPNGGNGGFVETSGHLYLDVAGIKVNAGAANGQSGTWLLDPTGDLVISHTASSTIGSSGGVFDGGGLVSTVWDGDINNAFTTTSVVIQTGGTSNIILNGSADSGGAVDIRNNSSTYRTLGFHAGGSINMHKGARIRDSSNGGLDVFMAADGGSVTIAGDIDVTSYGGGAYGQVWIGAHNQIFDRNVSNETQPGTIKAHEVHLASLYGGAANGLAISANITADKIYAAVGEQLGWNAPYTFFNGTQFYGGAYTSPAAAYGGIRIDNSGIDLGYARLTDHSVSGGNITFIQHQGDLSLDINDGGYSGNGSVSAISDSGDVHLTASNGNITIDCGSSTGYCGQVGVGKTFFLSAPNGDVSIPGQGGYNGYSNNTFYDKYGGYANLDIQAGGDVLFGYEAYLIANHVQIGSITTKLGGDLTFGSYGGITAYGGVDIVATGDVTVKNTDSYGYAFIHSNGGDINITANSVTVENDGYNGYAEIGVIGGSGNVNVTATGSGGINITNDAGSYGYAGIFSNNGNVSVISSGSGDISINNYAFGGTAGIYSALGNVTVRALHGSIQIGSYGYSYLGDGGNAGIAARNGNITVSASGSLDIFAENTTSCCSGEYTHAGIFTYGGAINVTAGSISMIGSGYNAQAGIMSGVDFNISNFTNSGAGGNVSVTSLGNLSIGGYSEGSAAIVAWNGSATVKANGTLGLVGDGGYAGIFSYNGSSSVVAGTLSMLGGGFFSAAIQASGGNVNITAGSMDVVHGGISSYNGDINILTPGSVTLQDSFISASSSSPTKPALLTIIAGGNFIADNSHVSAYGYYGGSVGIIAGDVLLENGSSVDAFAGPFATAAQVQLTNVNILSNQDIVLNNGSSIGASNDVILTLNNANSRLVLNESADMAPSFIWSDEPQPQVTTTIVNFTTRTSGGIFINGVETTSSSGSACAANVISCFPSTSGFFGGQHATPSALDQGLEVNYAVLPQSDPAGDVIDQFFSNLTKVVILDGNDDDKDKKSEDTGNNEGKDKNEQNQNHVGQCT